MKTFKAGDQIVKATHLWKTHPVARGARRFGFINRLCQLVELQGDEAIIKLSGSGQKKTVPVKNLIDLEKVNPKHYFLSL